MARLTILEKPNPRLNELSAEITVIGPAIAELAADMVETMLAHNGRGLAAPQVGELSRMFCMKYGSEVLVLCNPVITRRGQETATEREGCLSIPGRTAMVTRHKIITVEWTGLDGSANRRKMRGLDARCVQHEIDHLDGVLIL